MPTNPFSLRPLRRPHYRLQFYLERMMQRGTRYQLLVVAGAVAAIAAMGGVLAWALTDAFGGPGEAIWWAFLRLTDPGYLGDDEGSTLRLISVGVTVMGYVVFMGALIAILTQGLSEAMRRLESGTTPIALKGHILVLGWTNRTPSIVRELMQSEGRVQRFLQARGARRLRLVVLADKDGAMLRQELRDVLGTRRLPRRVLFRTGSSMRVEHLERAAFLDASAILLPGADFESGGADASDARVIKTLMTLAKYGAGRTATPPTVVAEIMDAQKAEIARAMYDGPLRVVTGEAFIGRLIAQNVRHPGLSYIYSELLSYAEGNEVYVRKAPDLAGVPFLDLATAFPEALVIGAVRATPDGFAAQLNPAPQTTFGPDDRYVFIAPNYEATAPRRIVTTSSAKLRPDVPPALPDTQALLLLGWSHKVPALLSEFASYAGARYRVDVASVVPVGERETAVSRTALPPDRIRVRHMVCDYTHRADLEALDLTGYDSMLFVGSDWLESSEETDARTILGHALLRSLLPESAPAKVILELTDPANAALFEERPGEAIISPVVLSHMLAHTALRPELDAVFSELFGPSGAEFFFNPATDYGPTGASVTFSELARRVAEYDEIALGIRRLAEFDRPHGGVYLNPPAHQPLVLQPDDQLIVLRDPDRER